MKCLASGTVLHPFPWTDGHRTTDSEPASDRLIVCDFAPNAVVSAIRYPFDDSRFLDSRCGVTTRLYFPLLASTTRKNYFGGKLGVLAKRSAVYHAILKNRYKTPRIRLVSYRTHQCSNPLHSQGLESMSTCPTGSKIALCGVRTSLVPI